MSCAIHWRPITDQGKRFKQGTSSDLGTLKEVFGTEISESEVAQLRAIAIATKNTFFGEVADVVERVGPITFWGEY